MGGIMGHAQQRVAVLQAVAQRQVTTADAAMALGLSMRQMRRLVARFRHGGASAVEHGNRGRQPVYTISPEVRQRVVALAPSIYQGCSHYQLSLLLAEREGLDVSRSSVRRTLLAAARHTDQVSDQRQQYQR